MRKAVIALTGAVVGVFCAVLFTAIVLWLYPVATGSGSDEMTQGILGTIVLVFAAPVFAIIGGIVAYKKY